MEHLFTYFVSKKLVKRPILRFNDVSFSLSFENDDSRSVTIINYLKTQISVDPIEIVNP